MAEMTMIEEGDGTIKWECSECKSLVKDKNKFENKVELCPKAQEDASPTMPKDIEMMAANRYRPVPSGVLAYKVVGGDGNRSLFSGTKDECQIVARKLTEAFLDGAHVALSTQPAAPSAQGDALDTAHFRRESGPTA